MSVAKFLLGEEEAASHPSDACDLRCDECPAAPCNLLGEKRRRCVGYVADLFDPARMLGLVWALPNGEIEVELFQGMGRRARG